MNSRQREELAKLYMDLGKLGIAGLIFGPFQQNSSPDLVLPIVLFGLTFSVGLIILGLRLFKDI